MVAAENLNSEGLLGAATCLITLARVHQRLPEQHRLILENALAATFPGPTRQAAARVAQQIVALPLDELRKMLAGAEAEGVRDTLPADDKPAGAGAKRFQKRRAPEGGRL